MSWKTERKKRHFYTVQEEMLIGMWCKVLLGKTEESAVDDVIHGITAGGGVVVEWRDIDGRRSYLVNRDHRSIKTADDGEKQWKKLNRQLVALYKVNGVSIKKMKGGKQ